MDSIDVCLAADASLSDIARVLERTLVVQDQSSYADSPQVVVIGDSNVYIEPLVEDELDPELDGPWVRIVTELMGVFNCYLFASADLYRVAVALEPVARTWDAIIDDQNSRLVSGASFLAWFARHPHPSWADVFDYTRIGLGDHRTWQEMPTLATYPIEMSSGTT